MALNVVHDSLEEIDEQYRDLYSEQSGKYVLTGITGVKTQKDIDKLQTSLNTERTDHKKTKDRFRPVHFGGKPIVEMNDDELRGFIEKMDGYDELVASVGQIDDNKINGIVETRINARLKPIERERDTYKQEATEAGEKIKTFEAKEKIRTIHDAVRKAISEGKAGKVQPTAEADILMLAERVFDVDESGNVLVKNEAMGLGYTPGVGPDVWFMENREKRSHWFEQSTGGGAKGGKTGNDGGANPWAHDSYNLTEQGKYVKQYGMDKAQQAAKSAGTFVGGPRPAKP